MIHGTSVGFMLHFFRAYPGRTALMVVLMVLAGAAEGLGVVTLLPLLETLTLGGAAEGSRLSATVVRLLGAVGLPPTVVGLLVLLVAAMTAKAVLLWLAQRQVGYTVAHVSMDLRLRVIRAVMDARWEFFVRTPAGRLANAVGTEAHRAAWAYRQACSALAGFIQAVVYLAVAFGVSWPVAVGAVVTALVVLRVLRGFVQRTRRAGDRQTAVMESLVGGLTEALGGIKPMKAMGREGGLFAQMEAEAEAYNDAERHRVLALEFARSFREPLFVVVLAAGLWAALTWAGLAFATISLLAILFYRMMALVGEVQSQYQEMTVGESALWSLLRRARQAEAAHERGGGSAPPPPLREGLALDDVSFGYGGRPVLSGVSLRVPAGAFAAVVGPSGAGKTTLVDLVTGLLRPDAGRVVVDGVPLESVDAAAWRAQIGYVPQETLLFHDTVFRNVAFGAEGATRDDVRRALDAAGALGFVERLEGGLDHVVGERGGRLSGGQAQRVMIARALVRRPRLLVLDEATTGLDPAVEAAVCETLRALRGRLTILAVSHQPAIQEAADVIVEVDRGGVAVREAAPLAPHAA